MAADGDNDGVTHLSVGSAERRDLKHQTWSRVQRSGPLKASAAPHQAPARMRTAPRWDGMKELRNGKVMPAWQSCKLRSPTAGLFILPRAYN